ncbi:MAG TPA: PQQ-binding-like beta-propeller repeat protein [Rectinemataceae bacterium]|nr:PQQ-binding-like beta-propeller repeat protein [Rectinemataceae bacterium]
MGQRIAAPPEAPKEAGKGRGLRLRRGGRARAAAIACLGLLLPLASAFAQGASAAPSRPESLEPAFRLPVGGRPVAGPLLDQSVSPALVWMISEDGNLYALSDTGRLVARIALGLGALDPGGGASLTIDPFGRPMVGSGKRLWVYTRSGGQAWTADLGAPLAAAPAFGSDGRVFVAAGSRLYCLNPSGGRLWSTDLPAALALPPGIDGSGDPVLALADGSLLVLSPYGRKLARLRAGAQVEVLAPMKAGSGEPNLAAGLADGSLLLVDGRTGRIRGDRPIGVGQAPIAALIGEGSRLYGLDRGGLAFAVSDSGSLLWRTATRCPDGRLEVFSERLVALSEGRAVSLSRSGELYREASLVNAAGAGLVSPAGLLFSPGKDWILDAYRFERPLGPSLEPAPEAYPQAPSTAADAAAEALAFDPDAADGGRKLALLADIEKKLRSGTIGADESAAAAYCSAVALGKLESGYTESERLLSGDPMSRSRACAVLGELGSPDYRAVLCRVLAEDRDQAVRAAACRALGAIAVDPGGLAAAAFLAAAARWVDEETALALMGAIESLALRSGTPPSAVEVRAILTLSRLPYGALVRRRAVAVLGRMAGYPER